MRILGTGSALPKKVVSNDDLAGFLDTNDEWKRFLRALEKEMTDKIMTTCPEEMPEDLKPTEG